KLLAAGADVGLRDGDGSTAADIAHKAARELTRQYLTMFQRLPPYLRKLMVVRPPKVDR
ncbi:hypothetical protein T484DRAFT_1790089, partial [Baffinella frigidus]